MIMEEQNEGAGGAGEDGTGDTLPFSLLLDKTLPSLVEIAAWNPGKDLLAMVTKDHQLVVHRLNWQRLWAVTPDLKVTAICWRPDGKALAVGHNDGNISIHDVENGDVLRKTQTHSVAVQCLYWAEEGQNSMGSEENVFIYEDRTPRFFPAPPKAPPLPGTAPSFDMSSVMGSNLDDVEGTNLKGTTRDVKHRLDILCSGDKDGLICLSAFGVFPIGKLGIRALVISDRALDRSPKSFSSCQLQDGSALQVSLSNDLRRMTVICSGRNNSKTGAGSGLAGANDTAIHCITVNTDLLGARRKELRQVALQASSVEELLDVLQVSLTVMKKLWSEAIDSFKEKIAAFETLLSEHGSNATAKDEFMGLLTWGFASPALQQFLAVSLGEPGLKKLSKSVDAAARELHNIVSEHMQPAAEIITFRLGELRGLSRWKARLGCVGLEEALLDEALDHAGMLLIQLERLIHIISDTTGGFRPFFVWLLKVMRQLSRDSYPPSEQLPSVDSMAVASFLQQDFEKDQISGHLSSVANIAIDIPRELLERMEELALMGGYSDSKFLQRTLSQEVGLLVRCCQEAFTMPLKVVSPQLGSPQMIPLCHLGDSGQSMSLMYTEVNRVASLEPEEERSPSVEYICFQINSNSTPRRADRSAVGIMRSFGSSGGREHGNIETVAEAITLYLDEGLRCVDVALYKNKQLLLLVAENCDTEVSGRAWLMLLQLEGLDFHQLSSTPTVDDVLLQCSRNGAVADVGLQDGKVRTLPLSDIIVPLAVSASRGLACVFTSQRRVFLFDLEEDEEAKVDDGD